MKFLIDQPVSPMLAAWLREGGHDAVHARERGLARSPDTTLIDLAIAEARVLVTSDLDFPRIVALSGGDGPGWILFRAGNIGDVQMLELLKRVLCEVDAAALPRSVVVVDEHSMRVASLPLRRVE